MSDVNQAHGTITAQGAVVSGDATPVGGYISGFDQCDNPSYCKDGNDGTYAKFPTAVTGSTSGGVVERRLVSDLGAAYTVSSISVAATSGGSHVQPTDVQYSSDGSSWSAAAGTWGGSGTAPRVFTLSSPASARYWRIIETDSVGAGLHGWVDWTVFTWSIEGSAASTADFSGTPRSGDAPLSVAFTDLSSGSPTSWAWNFGDGDTSTDQDPTHTYATPGTYTVSLDVDGPGGPASVTKTAYVVVAVVPTAWDVFAADDPLGAPIATLSNAFARSIRKERNGPGSGQFTINRHAAEATLAVLRKGNLVKVRIPEISTEYIHAFWLETGDFTLLSTDEEGGEDLIFGGRGALAYLDRARMWHEAFTTGLDISASWTEVWETDTVPLPVGCWYDSADPDNVRVIGKASRKVYTVRQSDGAVIGATDALFAGYAGGLSGDPSDSTIYWALEAPWLSGSASHCYAHKVRKSDDVVLASFDIGTDHFAGIRSTGSELYLPNQSDDTIHRLSRTDGSYISNFAVTYNGESQTVPTGVSYNATDDQLAYWFLGKARALIADPLTPDTITSVLDTQDLQARGGDWVTVAGNQFFVMVSDALGRTWKYQVTVATPRDPVSGIWRLDEGSAGAILERLIREWQSPSRPQQPIPDLTHAFDFSLDSDGNAWTADDGALEFTAQIGDPGLDVVLRLIRYGLTVQMSPGLALGAYNSFGTDRSSASFGAGKVRFVAERAAAVAKTGNIADGLQRQMQSQRVDSHMLAQGGGSLFATATDADLGYVREGFLSTQLTDATALAGVAAAELARERAVGEAIAFAAVWGDDELAGLYIPFHHYDVADTVRLHTGSGELDYDEQDVEIFAITLAEQENGEWKPVIEVAEGLTEPPSGGAAGDSGGGSGGIGGAPAVAGAATVIVGGAAGEQVVADEIRSDDWAVVYESSGVARVVTQWPALGRLANVDDALIVDGQTLVWDAAAGTYVPGSLVIGWFNVRNYGATGDGVTDDSAAINLAIADLVVAGGGRLYFPKGEYLVSAGLTAISVPTVIAGDGHGGGQGAGGSRIVCSSTTAVVLDITAPGCTVQGLAFARSGSASTAGAAIRVTVANPYASDGDYTVLDDIHMVGFYDNLDIAAAANWSLTRFVTRGFVRYGIRVRNTVNSDACDASIKTGLFVAGSGSTSECLHYEGGGGLKVSDIKINGNAGLGGKGFVITPGATSTVLVISESSIENVSGDGIVITLSGGVTWKYISLVGLQFGLYGNTTGSAIKLTAATVGDISHVVIDNIVARSAGSAVPAVSLTKVDQVYVGAVETNGFSAKVATSGCTNVIDLSSGATPSGAAGGDLGGTYPNPTVTGLSHVTAGGDLSGTMDAPTVAKLQGRSVSSSAPTTNQALAWTGSAWAPATISTTRYEPMTNGALTAPELVFTADGRCIMVPVSD